MSVETNAGWFSAPPKAGCRFTNGLFIQLGLKGNGRGMHVPEKFGPGTFTIVRNPIDWLRSYFQGVAKEVHVGPIDRLHELREQALGTTPQQEPNQKTLREFIGLYLKEPLDLIGAIFACYQPAETTWRIEDLPSAAEFHFGKRFTLPSRWQTPHRLIVNDDQAARIREHEREFCQQWRY